MSSLIMQAGVTVLLADFVSGVVHWVEDAYARPGAPLIGSLAENNLRHHWRPREFLHKNWLASSWDLLLAGAILIAAALYMGWLSWHVVLFALLVINANQIHKWAHMNSAEVPATVRWLQKLHILQTPRHHGKHHAGYAHDALLRDHQLPESAAGGGDVLVARRARDRARDRRQAPQ